MGKTGQTNTPHRRGYEFGEFTLDLDRAGLYRHNVDLQLRPQVLDVLCYLVARSGSLVTKEELLDEIWGDKAVTDDSLTHCIIEIRKALGDDNRQVIRTVPRRGFVFEEPVRRLTLTGSGMTRIRRLSRLRLIAAVGVAVVAAVYSIAATRPVETSGSGDEATANLSEYYEQARFLFHRRSPGDLDSAQEYYLNAIELDAQSAEAWAGLAGVYRIQSSLHEERREVLLDQLKAAAEKAIEIDPQNAEGWMRLSHYYDSVDDEPASRRARDIAEQVGPDTPLVLSSRAGRLAYDGDLEAAIALQQRAVALEPLSFVDRGNLSHLLFAAGRFEEAIHENQRAHRMRPAITRDPDTLVGFALVKLGSFENALDIIQTWPDGPDKFAALAMAGFALGRDEEAAQAVGSLLIQSEDETMLRMAELQAYCERIDAAFSRLTQLRDELVAHTDPSEIEKWIFRLRLSPFLENVRDDPRWHDWVQQTRDLVLAANLTTNPME
jgi:DNA-binding winged helix-turn-helix (wHTH) protein/Flp pilus assembly protein TadD